MDVLDVGRAGAGLVMEERGHWFKCNGSEEGRGIWEKKAASGASRKRRGRGRGEIGLPLCFASVEMTVSLDGRTEVKAEAAALFRGGF
jgi:hypothetical protein